MLCRTGSTSMTRRDNMENKQPNREQEIMDFADELAGLTDAEITEETYLELGVDQSGGDAEEK